MIETPKFIQRIYRSGYTPLTINLGWTAIAGSAGVLLGLAGRPWWITGWYFSSAGITLGVALFWLLAPIRQREIHELEKAELEHAARNAMRTAIKEAIENGTLPEGTAGDVFRVN